MGLIGKYQRGTDFCLNSAKLGLSIYCLRIDQAISGYSGLLILQDSKSKTLESHMTEGSWNWMMLKVHGEPSLLIPLSFINS